MVGVVLFSLFGMVIGILSAGGLVKRILKSETINRFLDRVDKFDLIIGLVAIFVGVWNLFSPNFGFRVDIPGADITILGATIPSLLVILSGASISLHYILQILNIQTNKKEQLIRIRSQYGDLIGIATFVFSFLHILTYQTVLL
ncbi:MAG: hypothetical protein RMJ37_00820 [Spirochaetia bacterium]|nr:hypothetical protein [Spirochaetota bacterium]MCX8097257.1 hypothetical protein [Spirochaetota bacterium]MDW8111865.1 hypothetical protein [Spirochaetia bacterium]